MKRERRKFSAAFKSKVAIEALKEQMTLQELAKKFDVHPNQITGCKRDFLENASVVVKRIRRLYKIMNLKTIYAYPKTTKRDSASYKYPYLLRNSTIERPNQVWQRDIIYIPMWRGFMYMVAIIHVNSRKILNWSLSNSMTAERCAELLRDTIDKYGKHEIHNSDQGSQFTSEIYIDILKKHDIQISMDGKGRALDNVYIERFWRSIKQEKIYLNPANGGLELYHNVREYVDFYNSIRRHTEITKVPPNEIYFKKTDGRLIN